MCECVKDGIEFRISKCSLHLKLLIRSEATYFILAYRYAGSISFFQKPGSTLTLEPAIAAATAIATNGTLILMAVDAPVFFS